MMNVDDAVRLAVEHDYNLPNISRRYRYADGVQSLRADA